MADVKNDVNDIVNDLKTKIDNLTEAADQVDEDSKEKANEIRDRAVGVLSTASKKIVEAYQTLSNTQEVEKGVGVIKAKSKELYDDAMRKINTFKKSKTYNNAVDYAKKTVSQVKNETVDFVEGTKNNMDEFFAKPEVKQSINNAKLKTVDMAEKALDTLKQWLKPEDDK